MTGKKNIFVEAIHIYVLYGFAVAQPIFDLLTRNAEFFIARRSEPIDVFFLILVLCVLLPTLTILLKELVGIFSVRARRGLHIILVIALITIILLPPLKTIGGISGTIHLVSALTLALVFTVLYTRFWIVKMYFTYLAPAILIFPVLFLFNASVQKVVSPEKEPASVSFNIDNQPPIIMVIFDELPMSSLMDTNQQVDPIRFPHFAALAQDASWFRNTTTVAGGTLQIVPAILSGLYPDKTLMPVATDYPRNLFTFLGSSYEMKVFETHTMLCPESLCRDNRRHQALTQRMYSLLSDISVVYLHIVLPANFTSALSSISQTWKDFRVKMTENRVYESTAKDAPKKKAREGYNDRAALFAEFVESIAVSDRPTLYFLHIILPHVPWEYLPSGKVYTQTEIPGLNLKREEWGDDEWLVVQGYQRHLLQLVFTDKLLGDLISKLKSLNLYDQSLIVITADHGVNFWPNNSRRVPLKRDPMGSLGVPLFIKSPNQSEGVISDQKVQIIDILPTIADILEISMPWDMDGLSVFGSYIQEREKENFIMIRKVGKPYEFEPFVPGRFDALERKFTLFGPGTKSYGLFTVGPHDSLIGQHLDNVSVAWDKSITAEFDQELLFNKVDPETHIIPAHITGQIHAQGVIETPFNLAVAVNGTIRAVMRTFGHKGSEARFSAMVPEDVFQRGMNEVEVFVVSEGEGQPHLIRTRIQTSVKYYLIQSSGLGIVINSSKGRSIPVVQNALKAHLDIADVGNDYVVFAGWAADVKNSQLPEIIVVFADGEFLYSGRTNMNRPDVAKAFDNPALKSAGFKYRFPLSLFKNIADAEVRIFAVSMEGLATELIYPDDYKWGKDHNRVH